MLLSLVDVEGVCMRHIPLRMLNVGGRIVVRTCFRFNIWTEHRFGLTEC